ncbi:MAG: SH3 domain-containing protein [Deltaproteobacteria bacterium]|nr:SH3 domain-containing protein [Deltaproteobacteria bacterium]
MNTPGFWIGLLENPDEIIIPKEDIAAFNETIRKATGKIKDITQYPSSYQGKWLAESFSSAIGSIKKRDSFTIDGEKPGPDFFETLEANMDIPGIPSLVNVRFGFVVAYTHQRVLPTSSGLYSRKIDHAFDRLQNSALDIGTPVAILYGTRDRKWLYVDAPLCAGWVLAKDVGICSMEQIVHYTSAEPFAVTLSAKTDIFYDEELTRHHAYVRMGSRFVFQPQERKGVVEILLPTRSADGMCMFISGFVQEGDVHPGYLPYTPRSIITQAFRLLNSPYGWGGMFGEQDCSRFIQEIFATAGISFPRNSTQQAKVGRLAAFFDASVPEQERIRQIFAQARGGISIMQLNGHIMLYLGSYNGELYAIHDLWGYAEPGKKAENLRVVNRVAVTDLSLGRSGSSGTLLNRMITVRVIAAD